MAEILRYDAETQRAYTKDQYIDSVIHALPSPDHLADIWERLPVLNTGYDGESDTLKHIRRVNQMLLEAATELIRRASVHDESKLGPEEKPLFDQLTPLLADSDYLSPEYVQFLKKLKPALDHHYANNDHHPEHYENGINGMDLIALLEMLIDWKAASERHENGRIEVSIEKNRERFGLSSQLEKIFLNTARSMGWLNSKP